MKPTLFLPVACAISYLAAPVLMAADPAKPAAAAPAAAPAPAPAAATYTLPEVVAVVEGEEVKKAELEQALTRVLAQQGAPADALSPEEKAGAYQAILEQIIEGKIVTKKAAGTEVSDAEFNETFNRIKGSFGSEEEMSKQLASNGMTLEKLKSDIRESMKGEKWLTQQVGDKAKVTEADAEAFYKQNPEKFQKPERVRASHILVKVEPEATPEQVIAKEKQARAILERVNKGEDFNKLASELSEDPSAKQNGGDLVFFQKEQMVPEFADAAFAMKKNEVSKEPVRSQFGYHLIKVTDREESKAVTLEEVKPKLQAFLQRQKLQSEVQTLVEGLRKDAKVDIKLPPAPAPAAAPAAAAAAAPAPAAK